MKEKKAKKPEKPNLVTCPKCASIDIIIYEHLDLLRSWFQDEDGPGGLLDFEEEAYPTQWFLKFRCESCSHEWESGEFATMEELMDEVYGEVVY